MSLLHLIAWQSGILQLKILTNWAVTSAMHTAYDDHKDISFVG